jgi:cysteine desulfurase
MSTVPLYLDYAASTPIAKDVVEAMCSTMNNRLYSANPSSNHMHGKYAHHLVDSAASAVANLLNANADEIVWTSGATEANNLVIKGILLNGVCQKPHLITMATEHKSILSTALHLMAHNVDITVLKPTSDGLVDLGELAKAIKKNTQLISIMWVNNETGVIQPIAQIQKLAARHNVLFHCDATQGIGKLPLDLARLPIDFLSLSAHKFYGPKGVGALIVKKNVKSLIMPQLHGGSQQQGLRVGTLPTHQIVGMGAACTLAGECLQSDYQHISMLAHRLTSNLSCLEQTYLNGTQETHYPGILNLSVLYTNARDLLLSVSKDISLSLSSACNSDSLSPSYVLRAMGLSEEHCLSALRLSFGRYTTIAEIDQACERLIHHIKLLREQSILWTLQL